MPRYTELELKTGYVISEGWYAKLVDILEQITEQGAVTYGGTVKTDILPDVDLLLNIGKPGQRFLEVHAGHGYFTYAVIVGSSSIKVLPDKIVFPDLSEQTRGADALVQEHEAKTTGIHGVGTAYIAKDSAGGLDLASHGSRHDIGGADAISGLASHGSRHDIGGADAIPGLASHASRHLSTGADPLFDQNLNTSNKPSFTGLHVTDDVIIDKTTKTDACRLHLKANTGYNALIVFKDVETTRWSIYKDVTNDLRFGRYDAAGTLKANPIIIDVDTGVITMESDLKLGGDLTVATHKIRTAYPTSSDMTLIAPRYGYIIGETGNIHLTLNAYWDGVSWKRFDTTLKAYCVQLAKGVKKPLCVKYTPAGANPITWTDLMYVDEDGDLWTKGDLTVGGKNIFLGNYNIYDSAGFLYIHDKVHAVRRWLCRYDTAAETNQFVWYGSNGAAKMILDLAGDLSIDGSYLYFSPELPETEEELKKVIINELKKPEAKKDKEGHIICSVCGKQIEDCIEDNPEHVKIVKENHGKDVGLTALATGKLLLKVIGKLEKLEKRITALEQRLGGLPLVK